MPHLMKRLAVSTVLLSAFLMPGFAQQPQATGISVALYDPGEQLLQVMFQDGAILLHEQVPAELYDSFSVGELNPQFYQDHIVTNYPPIIPDPDAVEVFGPIDTNYTESLKEPPPALFDFCEKAVFNSLLGGEAALREIDRFASRAYREDDDLAYGIATKARDIVLQTRSASKQAIKRMKRKEYHEAYDLVDRSAHDLKRLITAFAPTTKHTSSVSIREQHQASHFISKYSDLMKTAERALRGLRNAVEPDDDRLGPDPIAP